MRVGLGVTLGLHWGLLALGVVHGRELYEEKRLATYVFWTFAVTAMALSWITSCRDPGYCPIAETALGLQSVPECGRTLTNVVPKLPQEEAPEIHQLSESPLQDCSVQLELSLEASSSCKESAFQGISDPAPIPLQLRPEEISTLLSAPQPTLHAETSLQAASNPREADPLLRYCPLCNLEQRLRSKHCTACRRCVARYDHHCPWLSTCIGEKNHAHFLCFLYCQCTELIIGIALIAQEVRSSQDSGFRRWLGAGLIGTAAVLLILLVSLCCYQTWLLTANLTTWEHQSWKLITYLQTRKRALSPFSTGCKGNISVFCQSACRSELTEWKITAAK